MCTGIIALIAATAGAQAPAPVVSPEVSADRHTGKDYPNDATATSKKRRFEDPKKNRIDFLHLFSVDSSTLRVFDEKASHVSARQ